MDDDRKNYIFNNIISGIRIVQIKGKRYKIVSPCRETRLIAEYIYRDTMQSLRFDDLMTDEQCAFTLHRIGMWGPEANKSLEDLEKYLEDQKVRLYKSAFDSKKRQTIRKQIQRAKISIDKSLTKKHFLDPITLRYHAITQKRKFLVAMCLRDANDKPVYTEKTFWNSNSDVLENAIQELESDIITIEEFRELSRKDPWRTAWSMGKENIFGTPACDWTDDQKVIATFAKMYDNAYQNPECPQDEVIEDDDMFDGWMIEQRRKRDREVKTHQAEAIGNWKDSAQEVFITAPTREDADKVFELNDMQGRMELRERQRSIKAAGILEESKLPDVQRDLHAQSVEQYKNTVKGK